MAPTKQREGRLNLVQQTTDLAELCSAVFHYFQNSASPNSTTSTISFTEGASCLATNRRFHQETRAPHSAPSPPPLSLSLSFSFSFSFFFPSVFFNDHKQKTPSAHTPGNHCLCRKRLHRRCEPNDSKLNSPISRSKGEGKESGWGHTASRKRSRINLTQPSDPARPRRETTGARHKP